jgi:hypothetical protein
VRTALDRLDAGRTDYPEREEDASLVRAYRSLIESHADAVATTLFCGRALSAWRPARDGARLANALEQLSRVLGLTELRPEQTIERINRLATAIEKLVSRPDESEDDRKKAPLDRTLARIRKTPSTRLTTAEANEKVRAANTAASWAHVRALLRGERPVPRLKTVIDAVAGRGPFAMLKLPLETMTLREWSRAFHVAVTRAEVDGDIPPPPPWLACAALEQLGLIVRTTLRQRDVAGREAGRIA